MTPKQIVQKEVPAARLDFSELLRGEKKPCWFIREGWQGRYLHSGLFSTPRGAWKAARWALLDAKVARTAGGRS